MKIRFPVAVLFFLCILSACDGLKVPREELWYNEDEPFFGYCQGFETGNLLFVVDTDGAGGFCQMVVTECTDTAVYVYEVHPCMGVVRRPFNDFAVEWYNKFDTNYGFPSYVKYYYLDVEFDRTVLLNRLTRLLNTPPDIIDGVALVHQCFERPDGRKIFDSSDTTLLQLVNSGLLQSFRIE